MTLSYKKQRTFQDRKRESENILKKYPDRIPIICEKASSATSNIEQMKKCKFLVPHDLTMGQFMYIIRRRIQISSETGLFLFINNTLPPTHQILIDIYNKHKSEDGFLYITYSGEQTFGGKM